MASLQATPRNLIIALVVGVVATATGLYVYETTTQQSATTLIGDAAAQDASATGDELPTVTVYKSPTCNCCSKWMNHLRKNGFTVTGSDRSDMQPVKQELGVPRMLASCHTAVVGGYVVEGHVPAQDVKRLLREQPDVTGLTVPGMPIGSPGMERGDRVDPYRVMAFSEDGRAGVFNTYSGN